MMSNESTSGPIDLGRPLIEVVLRDGSTARLGPLLPEDRELLSRGLDQLSETSRFARFGTGLSKLTDTELRYLTEVDQVSHVAWGALIGDEPAGAGRYIVGTGADAELALTVVDRFQHRGLGRALFDALVACARAAGLEGLHFSIEPWNRTVARMLPGVDIELDEEDGMLVGRIEVASAPVSEHEIECVRLLDETRQGFQESGPATGSSSSDAELMQ
jgi:GNAT superfamily N-acetyltransferase